MIDSSWRDKIEICRRLIASNLEEVLLLEAEVTKQTHSGFFIRIILCVHREKIESRMCRRISSLAPTPLGTFSIAHVIFLTWILTDALSPELLTR